MVSGAIKLLSGGRTPASVSALLWLGAIVVMVGRAISVVIDRKRRPTGTRRTVVPRRTS
jgi:hypothetical protein